MGSLLVAGALIARRRGDFARARQLLEEQLALAREMGHTRYMSAALGDLGATARYTGNLAEAQTLLVEALRLDQETALPFNTAILRQQQGAVAYTQGDLDRATDLYQESLVVFGEMAAQWDCAACLEGLAAVAGAQGNAARAVRLWSAAGAIREAIGAPLPPVDRPHQETALAGLRAALGATTFEATWAEGRAMPLEQAIAYALNETG